MLLASRIKDVGGTALLYRSDDLIQWEFLHPLLTGSAEKDGGVWECPSFFPLGDKWVLIIAGKGRGIPFTVFYFIGSYANHQFVPEQSGILDHASYYAPISMQDRQGRRLLFGWLMEGRNEDAHIAAGWAGCHAIPRVLSLRQGQLHMEPIAELQTLRGDVTRFNAIQLSETDMTLDLRGAALDIEAEFEPAGTVGLVLACADDGSEQTRISYDPTNQQLTVNRDHSGSEDGSETFANTAPHSLVPGETLQLRILLDGSVLEVIANGRTSICSRIYPSHASSQGVRVFGSGTLKAMSAWPMASIWP
jgi:beta-fructofuranosidase